MLLYKVLIFYIKYTRNLVKKVFLLYKISCTIIMENIILKTLTSSVLILKILTLKYYFKNNNFIKEI